MNKRLLLNLTMLLAVLALAAVVVYQPGIEPPIENPPLTTLQPDEISRIEIVRDDGGLLLERRGDGWWIDGEPPVPADPFQVDSLLQLAVARPARSYPVADLDLAQLQLDPPQSTLRLDTTELRFGATDPLDHLRYVQTGDQVHLVEDRYQHILRGQRTQFASRRLLPEGADIQSLELPGMRLARQPQGGWSVEPPPDGHSADAAQRLVEAWRAAGALWVRGYQSHPGAQPVVIGLADGRRIEYLLHRAEGEVLLGRPDLGLQYQLPEESARPLFELRSAEPAGDAGDAGGAEAADDAAAGPEAAGETPEAR